MYYAQIGHKVRLAREEVGLSQEELGKRLNCSGVTVSSWETGKRRISLEDLHRVARVLRKPLTFLLPDGSLSLSVENQIGELLKRSIGEFLGTRQIPVFKVEPPGDRSRSTGIQLAHQMPVVAHLRVDFGFVMPDDRLAAIGITAGDVAVCRRCDHNLPHESFLRLCLNGASFHLCMVDDGEEVACPVNGGTPPEAWGDNPEAVCGVLVLTVKHAEDILANLQRNV